MSLEIILAALVSIIQVVGVPGNALVVVVSCVNRSFYTFHYLLLASLAWCNFLNLIIVVLPREVSWLVEDWIWEKAWCYSNAFFARAFFLSTISHLCALSYDRYTAIVKDPLRYYEDLTKRRVLWCIFFHWLLPAAAVVPGCVTQAHYGIKPGFLRCEDLQTEDSTKVVAAAFMPMYVYLIPFFATIRMNFAIVKTAHREAKLIRDQETAIHQGQVVSRAESQKQEDVNTVLSNLKKHLKQHRAARDGLFVIGAFVVCYFPSLVIGIVRMISSEVPLGVVRFCYCLAASNAACNPIIYSARKGVFRKTVRRFILRSSSASVQPTFSLN